MKAEVLLSAGLKELGIEATKERVSAFLTYLTELKKWQKAYSLTSLKKDEDIVAKHFLDSCLYLAALPEGSILVADVGSGAGFPGVPIKIIRPEIVMTLIEPSRKKSAFLRHIIRKLGIEGISVLESRIEELGGAFDIIVTRALYTAKEFVEKASPLLRPGGMLVMSKGPKVSEELLGVGFKYRVLPLRLPGTQITRNIVVIDL